MPTHCLADGECTEGGSAKRVMCTVSLVGIWKGGDLSDADAVQSRHGRDLLDVLGQLFGLHHHADEDVLIRLRALKR